MTSTPSVLHDRRGVSNMRTLVLAVAMVLAGLATAKRLGLMERASTRCADAIAAMEMDAMSAEVVPCTETGEGTLPASISLRPSP